MSRGIDPIHQKIMKTLIKFSDDPMTTEDIHRFSGFGTTRSIKSIERRLKTLQARGWVERRDYDHRAAWGATIAGRDAATQMAGEK